VKRVPAPGARINVTDDGRAVETAHLGFTTSPHEECAVEEAVQLAEAARSEGSDATVTVLTLGPPAAEEQLRYAASVGADEIVLVPAMTGVGGSSAWDPQRTARALTEAIHGLEAEHGRYDVILFGNESADSGGFQVGIRVACALGRPIVNGIKNIELGDDGETVIARRAVDAGFEVYRLPRPAVVGVKEGINLPRYPTMKGRLASKKVELVVAEPGDVAVGGQRSIRLHRPEESVSSTEILGEGSSDVEAAAAKVVDLLEELGVLP
jgi:electron transfer flavoprotein beta subunit